MRCAAHVATAVAVQPARARPAVARSPTGLRVCTVTGATLSVMVAGNSGGMRLGYRDADRVHQRRSERAHPCRVRRRATRSRPARGPSFVVGSGVSEDSRPVGEPVTGQVQQRLVALADADRCQRHLLVERRWSAAVRRPGAPCRRWRAPGRRPRRRSASTGVATAGRPAGWSPVPRWTWSPRRTRACCPTAPPTTSRPVRPLRERRTPRREDSSASHSLLRIGLAPRLGFGADSAAPLGRSRRRDRRPSRCGT